MPRHRAMGPSLRAMQRISSSVDGDFTTAPVTVSAPPRTHAAAGPPSQLGHEGGWLLQMPHLLQQQGEGKRPSASLTSAMRFVATCSACGCSALPDTSKRFCSQPAEQDSASPSTLTCRAARASLTTYSSKRLGW